MRVAKLMARDVFILIQDLPLIADPKIREAAVSLGENSRDSPNCEGGGPLHHAASPLIMPGTDHRYGFTSKTINICPRTCMGPRMKSGLFAPSIASASRMRRLSWKNSMFNR